MLALSWPCWVRAEVYVDEVCAAHAKNDLYIYINHLYVQKSVISTLYLPLCSGSDPQAEEAALSPLHLIGLKRRSGIK